MKLSELKQLIREEISTILKESVSSKVKIETNKSKIDLLMRKYKKNITLLTKDSYDNIVAIAYGDLDDDNRLQALLHHMESQIGKEPTGNLGYEFIEYVNGRENSFTV
jgi:glutamyl-tRNA reductase